MLQTKYILVFALVAFSLLSSAQGRLYGTIAVKSTDSLSSEATLVSLPELNITVKTDATGNFTLSPLPCGYLKLKVMRPGFKKESTTVYIKEDAPTLVHFDLQPQANRLDEIVVYGNQESRQTETSNSIDVMDTRSMREQGALSLSDGIARLPGVTQLSTGAGISKPVIRGLFGNRIQTVLLGIRFDNQQWQDEHGLGLSDVGVDHVEIIKGPSTLFYGSEAMGGVLNIINEKNAPVGTLQSDVSTRYFSNTFGYAFDAGVKKSTSKFNWSLRFGNESHADYSDGNNRRILNSRFGGYVAKAGIGFKGKNWSSDNTYFFGQSNFGFLMDAYQLYDKADDRQARSFERPHHTVLVNIFLSQNSFVLKSSRLKVNLGAHINNRQEQEGASGISLDMLLSTYVLSAVWQKNFDVNTEISIGTQNQYQTNVNNGSRIIVPDASLGETSLFAYLKKRFSKLVAEGGIRYDLKNIDTRPTPGLNSNMAFSNPGTAILPVSRTYNTVNGSLGLSYFAGRLLVLKLNGSSGYRGPNLAELSSNGLHEGSVRYELGNVNLKVEQNICTDFYTELRPKQFTLFADAYVNRFFNYIYLQPGTAEYIGFRIYNYIQENATLQGLESGIRIHPTGLKFLKLNVVYSTIQGLTDKRQYLPFIPAQKLSNEIRLVSEKTGPFKNCFLSLGYVYVFAQTHPNQFETSTPAYHLVNAGLGAEAKLSSKNVLVFSVSGNNLSNESYYDHLSRFKYFGIYNIGRSINLNLKFQFN